jgi:hypothetical protein
VPSAFEPGHLLDANIGVNVPEISTVIQRLGVALPQLVL